MKKNCLNLFSVLIVLMLVVCIFVSCGEKENSNHEHVWNEGTYETEPTCTEKGSLIYSCSECDETKTEEVEALGHTEVIDSAVASTCTQSGLSEGKHCSVCNEVLVAQTYTAKLPHNLVNDVCTVCFYEVYTNGLIFELNDGENDYSVVGYEGTLPDVIIPATYNQKPVVAISNEAFKGNTVISTIKIPSSITEIGASAFYECENLEEIEIPDTVNIIKDFTFYKCENLETVTFLGNIRGFGESAFEYCESLGSITIPESCETISDRAFSCCYSLSSINLPNGLTYLGGGAFRYCQSLTSVTVPSSINTIHSQTFFYCITLKNVTISEGVRKIESYAFQTCKQLQALNIPASVNCIEAYCIAYADLIQSITVDANNTTYDSRSNCNAVIETETNTLIVGCSKTSIPSGITAIAEAAFFYCTGISNVYIPDTVETIGKSAFSGCESLGHMVIPESVTRIEDGTFANCKYLRTVDIKGDVTYIGSGAFKAALYLEKIILPASITFIGENAFTNASPNATIYYRGTYTQWSEINNQDSITLYNYQHNGNMIFAYTGD